MSESSAPITNEELDEIAARCAAASPGPWISYVEGRDHTSGSNFVKTSTPEGGRGNDIEMSGATWQDQDFIAHARQDIPLLLDAVRHLTQMLQHET